ncbi:MAG: dTMP kinase, partial [Spirochaetales bacterium]|nr:dTMP kinase [Spirochaetales bacterium]
LARLFAADRFDHLYHGERGIRAALDRGFQVVCDRYLFSSLAYQSPALGYQETLGLNDFPLPEKLFFFDVPPELCALRRAGRERQELFDPPEIQVEVAKNYRMILADFAGLGMEIHRIDGSPPREEVFEGLKALLFPPDQPIEG